MNDRTLKIVKGTVAVGMAFVIVGTMNNIVVNKTNGRTFTVVRETRAVNKPVGLEKLLGYERLENKEDSKKLLKEKSKKRK